MRREERGDEGRGMRGEEMEEGWGTGERGEKRGDAGLFGGGGVNFVHFIGDVYSYDCV